MSMVPTHQWTTPEGLELAFYDMAGRRKEERRRRVAQTYRSPTRAERQGTHHKKMQWKAGERTRRYIPRHFHVRANLSRNHPDYGCTPAEHAKRKAARA